jgi:hypothetical protein
MTSPLKPNEAMQRTRDKIVTGLDFLYQGI